MITATVQPYPLVKRVVKEPFDVWVEIEDSHQIQSVDIINTSTQKSQPLTRKGTAFHLRMQPEATGLHSYMFKAVKKNASNTSEYLVNQDQTKYELMVQVDPSFLTESIFYSVFVRFFKGQIKFQVERNPAIKDFPKEFNEDLSQKSINATESILPGEGGTFDDVKLYLDTLKDMGISVLYFNPIHLIGEIYRGYNMLDQLPSYLQPGSPYSIRDYKSIDPELTYDKDTKKHLLSDPAKEFRDLIQAAHERDMYIIMDLVFNHTAHDFVFQRIRPEWYLYKEDITDLEAPYLYPEDVKLGKPWGDPKHSVPPYDHEVFWHDCAQLNWEYKITPASNHPPNNTSLFEMWEYFKSIPKYWIEHFGVDGFRCDVAYRVPPAFWEECIAETRDYAQHRKTNLAHDVIFIAESYTNDLETLQHCGFSAVYGDFSHKLARPSNLKPYLDYIYNIGSHHFPDGSKWFNFPDSHDFDRAPRKILGDEAVDPAKALLANQSRWVLSATLPGIPLLFNGFEKVEWQPINIWSYGAINWESDSDLKEYITQVNSIRNSHRCLQIGDYAHISSDQPLEESRIVAYIRRFNNEICLIVVNMDVHQPTGAIDLHLPEEFANKNYHLTDLLTNQTYHRDSSRLTIMLDPGQSHIFQVEFD